MNNEARARAMVAAVKNIAPIDPSHAACELCGDDAEPPYPRRDFTPPVQPVIKACCEGCWDRHTSEPALLEAARTASQPVLTLAQVKALHVQRVYREHNANITHTAAALAIDRRTMQRYIDDLKLAPPRQPFGGRPKKKP